MSGEMPEKSPGDLTTRLLAGEEYAALLTALAGIGLASIDRAALLVPLAGERSRLRLVQFDGGRDAKYVAVTRANPAKDIAEPLIETLGYAPSVQGVELVYDLTAETMQGKTRPFDCDLTGLASRVYAILPVQIEGVTIAPSVGGSPQQFRLHFRDASGAALQAALPFELTIVSAAGAQRAHRYGSTDEHGICKIDLPRSDLPSDRRCTVVVRSLLTGHSERVSVENP